MKEYVGNTANLFLVEANGSKLIASAEVVLIVSEPNYQPDGGGGFAKLRANEMFRFSTGVEGLKALIKQLQILQKEAELLEERASIEPEKEQP